jgi:hypothetical protein
MENKKAIAIIKDELNHCKIHLEDKDKAPEYYQEMNELCEAYEMAIKALEKSGWIPIKTEKISEAEKKELAERYDMSPEDFDDCWRYACKMPEDNQECLITTSVWGYVVIDTFHIDEEGAMYFEEHEDEDEVLAWMPLPEPYTKEERT